MSIDDNYVEDLIIKRKAAEKAVDGMPDGPMKEKAFEMVLSRLLNEIGQPTTPNGRRRGKQARKRASAPSAPTAATRSKRAGPRPHLDGLLSAGFFDTARSLPETAVELRNQGHIFEQEALSPHLLRMTREKVLRRDKAQRNGEKEMWFYKRVN